MSHHHHSLLQKMLGQILSLGVAAVSWLALPQVVQAQKFDADDALTLERLNELNPLQMANSDIPVDVTPGALITRALGFAFPIAGMLLFVMLVWAGFEIVSGATSKKSLDAGKQRATAAIIGFFLLFVSYWLIQLVEVIFQVSIV